MAENSPELVGRKKSAAGNAPAACIMIKDHVSFVAKGYAMRTALSV